MPEPAQHFRHCPRCGAPNPLEAVVTGLGRRSPGHPFDCGACGFVLYMNAAAAVAALLVDGGGRVLFIRRARPPGQGKLALPGGFVDLGETAEDALRREVREEVGVTVGALTYLCSVPNHYPYRDVVYTTLDLFFTAPAGDLSGLGAHDAVESICWLRPADIDPDVLAFDSMREAVRRFLAGPRAG